MIALALGVLLALMIADVPLARLAHQSVKLSGGSLPVWFSAAFGAGGLHRGLAQAGQPARLDLPRLGRSSLALSEDASFYTVADYRLRHGGLPLGWVAVLAQPGWAPAIVLAGLAVLLFPDGQPPSPRWRWVLRVYLAVAVLWIGGAFIAYGGRHHRSPPSGGSRREPGDP